MGGAGVFGDGGGSSWEGRVDVFGGAGSKRAEFFRGGDGEGKRGRRKIGRRTRRGDEKGTGGTGRGLRMAKKGG
jgi:hypothetical protein